LEFEKIARYRNALEHEKLRCSIIRKENDDMLHELLETRTNASKILTADQLNQIQMDIDSHKQNIQVLYYENTRNELLSKGQKTIMEVAHIRAANGALENDILSQLDNVTAHIRNLEEQLTQLQQHNTQIMGESNEMRIAAMQTQGNLEVQIAQLQIEKQNLENLLQQMRSQ
jgi:hypothetical protein